MVTRNDEHELRRWSVEQRLTFAANRLFWDGTLQRDDLVRRFGLSPAQATADLADLRRALGAGIAYDVSRRAYVPTDATAIPPLDADGLLSQLRRIAEGVLEPGEGILSAPPPIEIAGYLARSVDPCVLRAVLWAIRDQSAISARYVSFQRPEVTRRRLSPHALVFDGFRWHARAHDAEDGRFKDFVLSRLSEPVATGNAAASSQQDAEWQKHVWLQIAPHPDLTEHQKVVVMMDYGMVDGLLSVRVRQAVEYYTRRRLGLGPGHERRPPQEQQIVLASREAEE